MKKQIGAISVQPTDPETLQLFISGTSTQLSRFEAIKLRNFLNEFINNQLEQEEEEDEPNGSTKQRIY